MKIRANQLSSHLKNSLAPCYLVTGDEPLLVGEALDDIREAARQGGFGPVPNLAVAAIPTPKSTRRPAGSIKAVDGSSSTP